MDASGQGEPQGPYLKRLSAEYTGARYLVTGRDPDGTYQWEERRVRIPTKAGVIRYRPSGSSLRPGG